MRITKRAVARWTVAVFVGAVITSSIMLLDVIFLGWGDTALDMFHNSTVFDYLALRFGSSTAYDIFVHSSYVLPFMFLCGLLSIFTYHFILKPKGNTECRCRKCGYILKGISEPKCSECGESI